MGLAPRETTESEIRDWCLQYIRRIIDDPAISVAPDATFAEMGLDSATSAYFVVELEEWLGDELYPEIVFDHPTIGELAAHIAARQGDGDAASG